ncbi:MAG: GNAT family N-acetyltransferase [Clostridia bacterium]|nr:GNAT family N-acetyltransferase [Clostridia bacterium]
MDHLIFSCDFDNAASIRTIEHLGARLLETVEPPKDYVFYYDGIAPHRIYRLDLSSALRFITLRERPELKDRAAEWFHSKWGVPKEAYLACMDEYLSGETEYGWYLCLDGETIAGGLGVIENDFHDRKDLAPNVCAVYTDEAYRRRGIAGALLNTAVEDLRAHGISPVYLVTDHTGFYERYGWEFLCMVQGDGEPDLTRMYIHR